MTTTSKQVKPPTQVAGVGGIDAHGGMAAIFGIVSENGIAKEASPVYLLDMLALLKPDELQRIADKIKELSNVAHII